MIDEATIVKIIATCMGMWGLGFGIGKAVAWTKALRGVA